MKNFLTTLVCAAFAVLLMFGFTACNPNDDGDSAVHLVALNSGAEVLARDDIDYFIVAEPAASARVKATADSNQPLNFVGDLQELYGGESGYPQAVIVAKNSLLESDAIGHFVEAIKENAEWLLSESTEISTVVSAVTSHLPDGTSPTFNANNLNKQVIENCGIRYSNAFETKEETKSFLTALKAVQPSVNDSLQDGFFWNGDLPAAASELEEISVYAPDGAPALALAGLMAGEVSCVGVAENINYNIVDASTIQTHVTGANPDADICILPVNLASNLLGGGQNYTMLGTVTHGNLYILSAKTGERLTVENLSSLKGKTVGVVNLAAVPGLTFKLILNKNGIEYSDPKS